MPRPQRRAGRPTDYDWEIATGEDFERAAGSIVQFEVFLSDTAETLMRLRGDVIYAIGQLDQVAGDRIVVAWGVIRAASGSSDVGVSPLTEGGAPWLAYGIATLMSIEGSANLGFDGATMLRWAVDSRAMRKLRENESLYVVTETLSLAGAPPTNFAFALRGLTGR